MNANHSKNRTAAYYDSPDLKGKSSAQQPVVLPEPEPVPVGPIAKRELLSQAVFEAIQLYRVHLRHPNPKIAERAAHAILSLQLAQLRHGGGLEGTCMPSQITPLDPMEELIEARYGEEPLEAEELDEDAAELRHGCIEYTRRLMQREADLRGFGEYVDRHQARYFTDHPNLAPPGIAPKPTPPKPPASHPHWE